MTYEEFREWVQLVTPEKNQCTDEQIYNVYGEIYKVGFEMGRFVTCKMNERLEQAYLRRLEEEYDAS